MIITFLAVFFGLLLARAVLPDPLVTRLDVGVWIDDAQAAEDPAYRHVILPAIVRGAITEPSVIDPLLARLNPAEIGRALDPFRIGSAGPPHAADAIRRRLTVVAGVKPGTAELSLASTDSALADAILAGLAAHDPAPAAGMARVAIRPIGAPRTDPSSDGIGHALLLATGAGLVAALAALLIREWMEKGFTSPDALEAQVGLPVLAAVPEAAGPHAPAESVSLDPDQPFARAVRALAEEVDIGSPLALALCSALPAEGKTTVSIALARALASEGRRVVLVDCDGRRRALSRAFGDDPPLGLVDLMAARATIEDVLERDPLSDVALIRHGRSPQDFSNRTAARTLVRELRQRFDLVLLDTGPVLALAEARVIASVVDEVLLMARWRRTPVAATRLALKLLYAANARLAGAALTRVGRPSRAAAGPWHRLLPLGREQAPPDEDLRPARARR